MKPMIRLVILLLLALAGAWSLHRAGVPAPASAQEEETFVPSEELPAGSAVSFPVDI